MQASHLLRRHLVRAFAAGLISVLGLPLLAHAAGGGAGTGAKATTSTKDYEYYLTGSTTSSLPVPTPAAPGSGLLALLGGGLDVDEAFRRMVVATGASQAAPMRFVVLRASGADGYNPYLAALSTAVGSVETLVVKSTAGANLPFVLDKVRAAHAVFIAGGDQASYVTLWNGTALEQAVKDALAAGKPVGGTSAGLAVLGGVDYTALKGSVTSSQALANPYNRYMTLGTDFLETTPNAAGTLFDSHIVTRDRLGRMVAFLARMAVDVGPRSLASARAIGLNEETALIVTQGVGTVIGNCGLPGSTATACNAYILQPAGNAPTQLTSGKPLEWNSGVVLQRLAAGFGSINLATGVVTGGNMQVLSVSAGVLSPANPY